MLRFILWCHIYKFHSVSYGYAGQLQRLQSATGIVTLYVKWL